MKLVITGALGHIGSRLIQELPKAFPKAEITLIDNFMVQRYPSLFNLPKEGQFRFIEGDVTEMKLTPLLQGADAVIHLAAITNAAGSFEIRDQIEKVNFNATKKVAEACLETGTRMLYLSTTSVYGTQSEVVDENCPESDLKPQSPYAETKLREEKLLIELGEKRDLKFVTCRFGTIFGVSPGMRFHTAVNKFCWQAVLGQPITVWRTALHQMRPYLDLEDGVRAIRFIIENNHFDKSTYNVLTLNATVFDIVSLIEHHVPDTKIEYVDTQIMNQLSYRVDNARFKALGFEFKGDLKRGIRETVQLIGGARHGAVKG